jgi:hypothetical protein
MFWLFMAIWLNGHQPSDYKVVAKIGPFDTREQCLLAGVLSADEIQSKDDVSNALGACKKALPLIGVSEPSFLDFKSMCEMVCASQGKDDMCWFKNGRFVSPLQAER